MFHSVKSKFAAALAAGMALSILLMPQSRTDAADHADATLVAAFPGADIADVYAFLDPTNNSNVILAMDVEGFVVPSEMTNLGFFSPDVKFEFQIENTGDSKPDLFIDVTFSPQTSRTTPQDGSVKFSTGPSFTGPTTVPTLAATAPAFTVTTDPKTGVSFFAGLTDDPFFFDIVGFNRFVSSVTSGAPDPTQLERGRDSFAGYNSHMIALSVPVAMLKGSAGSKIGVNGVTFVRKKSVLDGQGDSTGVGKFTQFDRMGNPAVNTVLIPYPMKNEYNASTPVDDAKGKFASAIEATLTSLGTQPAFIQLLAGVAVTTGDYLRLDTSAPNSTLGVNERFGSAGFAGFPNGRRPGDDVVDTLILVVTNEAIATGDNVNTNDVPFGTAFPFFAPPHQPQPPGGSDGTKN